MRPSLDIPDLAFITCIERGPLEAEALLLYASLRRFGGAFAHLPVYAVTPRPGRSVTAATRQALAGLQVEYLDLPLNLDLPGESLYNKAVAAAYIETHTPHELLAWLDSDMLFFRQPDLFALPAEVDAAVTPVFYKLMGTAGPGDRRDLPWLKLYRAFDVPYQEAPFVTTRCSQERIRFYYNSGLFVTRRAAGILSLYREIMAAMATQMPPAIQQAFRYPDAYDHGRLNDQPALAMAIWKKTRRVQILPPGYNYMLMAERGEREAANLPDLQQAVLAHHLHSLDSRSVNRHWMFQPDSGLSAELRAWLIPFLPLDQEQLPPAEAERIQDGLRDGCP